MSSTQYILCKGSKDTTFIISIGMCWWLRCRHHWDLGVTVLCRQMFIVGDGITELVFLIPMGCWNYRIIVGRWQFKCIQCTRLTESSVCVNNTWICSDGLAPGEYIQWKLNETLIDGVIQHSLWIQMSVRNHRAIWGHSATWPGWSMGTGYDNSRRWSHKGRQCTDSEGLGYQGKEFRLCPQADGDSLKDSANGQIGIS